MEDKKDWTTVHATLKVNEKTLERFGDYVDFIHLPEQKISVRIVVSKKETPENHTGHQLIGTPHPVKVDNGEK